MIFRPPGVNVFELATLAGRRAHQLHRGCLPRVDGHHQVAVVAVLEVTSGRVTRADGSPLVTTNPASDELP